MPFEDLDQIIINVYKDIDIPSDRLILDLFGNVNLEKIGLA